MTIEFPFIEEEKEKEKQWEPEPLFIEIEDDPSRVSDHPEKENVDDTGSRVIILDI